MHLDHEFLADRHAALGFGAPETYASSLVAMAAPAPAHSVPGLAPRLPTRQAPPGARVRLCSSES